MSKDRIRPVLRRRAFIAGLVALLCGAPVLPAMAVTAGGGTTEPAGVSSPGPSVDGSTVVVRFAPGTDAADRRQVALDHGTGDLEEIGRTGFFVLATKPGGATTALGQLAGDARVAAAEPNYVRAPAATPKDPRYAKDQASYFDTMRLPLAWELAPGGDNQVLAVIDSGVDLGHPDLAGRLLPGRDVKNDDDDPSDEFRHGTEVATVAAAAVDDKGMAGVTRRGKILPVKVAGADGKSTDAVVAEGIVWAADHGADVINISMGGPVSTGVLKAAVEYAQGLDVLIVAAAGNQATGFATYPGAYDGVVAVGAVDSDGRRAEFSNYGPWVDVVAPGVDILVGSLDRRYYRQEGTSYATPIVAGIALLLRGAFPAASAEAIADRLRTGARDTGPLGFDDYYGAGVVDAVGALGYPRARADELAAEAPDSSAGQARPLAIANGAVTTGTLSFEGDVDWFTFEVARPTWYTFGFSLAAGGPSTGVSVDLIDAGLRTLGNWSPTRLPAGRYYVRVRGKPTVKTPAPYEIRVVYGRPPGDLGLYDPQPSLDAPLGSPAVSVAAGDLTGDGRADLLVSTGAGGGDDTHHGLFVLPNGGTKSFGVPVPIPSDAPATGGEMGVTLADLDGDGDLDAAVATATGVELHLQSPRGLGGPAGLVAVPSPAQVEAGDVDGDGDVDLVTGGPNGVHLLRRSAGGDYEVVSLAATPAAEVEVADVDSDGRPDIVALSCPDDCATLALFRSSGAGFTRTDATVASAGKREECVLAVGDGTGDGYRDAFTACGTQPVQFFTGSPTGLAAQGSLTTDGAPAEGPAAEALETADFDGDGRDELMIGSARTRRLWALWPAYDDGWFAENREIRLEMQATGVLGPKGLVLADLNGDALPDAVAATGDLGPTWLFQSNSSPSPGFQNWVRDTVPADGASGVAPDVQPTIRLARPVSTNPPSPLEPTLRDGLTGRAVPVTAEYDVANGSVVLHPGAPLVPGRSYSVMVKNVRDTSSGLMPTNDCCFRFVVGQLPGTVEAPGFEPTPDPPTVDPPGGSGTDLPVGPAQTPPPVSRSGYWMLDADGRVYAFGDAVSAGEAGGLAVEAADLEPTPTGRGYWILRRDGSISNFGDAAALGGVPAGQLPAGQAATSLSATPTGRGYWIFTTAGRVIPVGDAAFLGDLRALRLNGPILDSIATPTGRGYYMVGSDGGIFAYGDAAFAGSMGGKKLNAPVQSLVPDSDGSGYWLVASDGGIFAFDAPFRGSMGGRKLNKPVSGMVRYGDGYLMVGADGGIFNFSSSPFAGSLGDKPPASPVVAVAAL